MNDHIPPAATPLRAAVLGVGAMGRNHVRVYADLDDVRLVGVADANAAAAERVGHVYRTASYDDHRHLLAAERPDLVSVVVPTRLHAPVVRDALEAGAHVLVEKPIAFSGAEAREMIERARDLGRTLMVGHVERFNPAVRELKRRLELGELGKVYQIHARRLGPFPARIRDVGVVIDLATHDLDVMRYLLGAEVRRLQVETEQRIHTDYEDLLSGLLKFDNGTIGVLDINWLTPTKVREISVTGERGMFVANYLTQDLYFYENDYAAASWDAFRAAASVTEGNMTRLRIDKREPLRVELESFVAAVRHGLPPIVSGEDGLAALALAERIVELGRANAALDDAPLVPSPGGRHR